MLYIVWIWVWIWVLNPPCCCCHVNNQCQLCHFAAIHNSSPVASWDSKVSTECALQNLGISSRSSGNFSPTGIEYYEIWYAALFTYCFSHTIYWTQRMCSEIVSKYHVWCPLIGWNQSRKLKNHSLSLSYTMQFSGKSVHSDCSKPADWL